MSWASFNQYGDCVSVTSGKVAPDDGLLVPDGTQPGDIWLDGDTIRRREPCPVDIPDVVPVGTGFALDLPDGCVALVNGIKVHGPLRFDDPGHHHVDLRGRYHLQKFVEVRDYAAERRSAYPSIEEQLDMLYHDPDQWRETIAAIKAAHPKS